MSLQRSQQDLPLSGLHAVVALADELTRSSDFDHVFRQTVAFVQSNFGLERCSLYIEANGSLCGTFGTNVRGEMTDEHARCLPMDDVWKARLEALESSAIPWTTMEDMRPESEDEPAPPSGERWVVLTPIRSAQKWIGVFFNQGATREGVLDPAAQELLSAFCSLLGSIVERKRAENALAQERNLLRTLIDTVPDYIFAKDTQGRFLVSNKAHAQAANVLDPNAFQGKTASEFFPSDFAAQYAEDDRRVLESGQPLVNVERLSLDAAHQPIHVATTKVPLHDAEGKVIGIAGISRDISAYKRAETVLAEDRNLLRTIIDSTPDYLYIKDRASRFVMGNIATARSLGAATPDDIVGKTDFDFHPQALAEIFFADEQALMQSGKAVLNREEAVIDQRTGDWQQLLSTNVPLYDSQGQIIGLVGFNRDITERVRTEQALQQSEERYRAVTDLISDYAFSMRVEPDGTLVDEWITADSFTRLTGYRSEEIGARYTLYHPEEVDAVQQQIQAVLRGETSSHECRILTKDGRTRWLHLLRRPIWDAQQKRVVRYYGVAQDISARKEAEEAQRDSDRLRLALEQEKELGELKTKLMITISHEFRTPLSVAYTSAELLEKYYERMTVPQRETHLHRVEAQIKKLTGMLEDISLLIHARFGQLTLNLEPTNLRKLCEAALLMLEDVDDAPQRIVVTLEAELPDFMLDARRIQYVLSNLLTNALKYSERSTQIALDLFRHNQGVMIRVTDQGIGISQNEQASLFEPFYRADNVGAVGGTGLGLSIVKEIVEMHGGTITLKSELHQGTQVTVFLPGQSG